MINFEISMGFQMVDCFDRFVSIAGDDDATVVGPEAERGLINHHHHHHHHHIRLIH